MKTIRTKAASISAQDISTIAAQGVARALEARKATGEELSIEQVEQVSGAAFGAAFALLDRWIIYGGPRYNPGGFELPGGQTIGAMTLGF
jgi:hypothetical protein